MLTTVEKRQKRCELWTQAKGLMDKASQEKRGLRGEEEGQYQALIADIDRLKSEVDHEERGARLETEFAKPVTPIHEPGARTPGAQYDPEFAKKALAVRNFIRGKGVGNAEDVNTWSFAAPDPDKVDLAPLFEKRSRESRSLVADNATSGGTLVPVEQFLATLIKFVDDQVFIRRAATVIPLTQADSLGVPTLDTDMSDPDWTEEVVAVAEDTAMKTGKRALKPTPLTKLVKISNKLIRISAINIEALVAARLAYKFGIAQEKAFMTGTGAGQALGLFTASADGIPSSGTNNRDTTFASQTAWTGDEIMTLFYSVKVQYQNAGCWVLHRDGVAKTRKLKDGNSNYIWAPAGMGAGFPSLSLGQPDTLMGRPIIQSEYAPNVYTTGKYAMLFGDLQFYWIAEALNMQLQRLMELYAPNNKVGYIGRMEVDGQPVLAEAFARGKMA